MRVEAVHVCRIRDYNPDSPCLFLRHFFLGRHPAPHLPPVPGLLSVRKEWAESVCDVDVALWLEEQLPQVLFTSSEARMHSPRLETMLVLKVHMPSPEWTPFGASALTAFRIVSWAFISEVMWLPENLRFRKSTFLNILVPGNGSNPWTLNFQKPMNI